MTAQQARTDIGPGQVTSCDRCGAPCVVSGRSGNPEATFLRLAGHPHGYCVNCGVAELMWVTGLREQHPDPAVLRFQPVQAQFAKVMASGMTDASPSEIDWEAVIRRWDLPFRVGRRMVDPVKHPGAPRAALRRAQRK